MIILYNKSTGQIIGTPDDPIARVEAWLEGNPEIAAETGYLVYDETLDPDQAKDIMRFAAVGKYYVTGGKLYQDSTFEVPHGQ